MTFRSRTGVTVVICILPERMTAFKWAVSRCCMQPNDWTI